MAQLTLYTHPMSRGRLGRMLVEETGQEYETVVLDFDSSMKAEDYLEINPMGKVPAIRHGDAVVTEVAAIAAYLGDAFPDMGLAPPPGDQARGPYYRWLFFAAGPLEAAVFDNSMGMAPTPDIQRSVGYGSFERALGAVEDRLEESDWLAGDRVSMADIYMGAQLRYYMMTNAITPRPVFERYAEKLAERPACQRATEKDDALAAEMGLGGA